MGACGHTVPANLLIFFAAIVLVGGSPLRYVSFLELVVLPLLPGFLLPANMLNSCFSF